MSNTTMFDAKTGPQLTKAVGDGLSQGTAKGKEEWSRESNICNEDPPETEQSPANRQRFVTILTMINETAKSGRNRPKKGRKP
jgi:hypothetical protein